MKSIALQNRAGARTHPCLTPEVVVNGEERCPRRCMLAVWRSTTRSRRTLGTLMPFVAFQSAVLSTESKADFRSTNAASRGCWKSRYNSANSRSARIASSVEPLERHRMGRRMRRWSGYYFAGLGSYLPKRLWCGMLPASHFEPCPPRLRLQCGWNIALYNLSPSLRIAFSDDCALCGHLVSTLWVFVERCRKPCQTAMVFVWASSCRQPSRQTPWCPGPGRKAYSGLRSLDMISSTGTWGLFIRVKLHLPHCTPSLPSEVAAVGPGLLIRRM